MSLSCWRHLVLGARWVKEARERKIKLNAEFEARQKNEELRQV